MYTRAEFRVFACIFRSVTVVLVEVSNGWESNIDNLVEQRTAVRFSLETESSAGNAFEML